MKLSFLGAISFILLLTIIDDRVKRKTLLKKEIVLDGSSDEIAEKLSEILLKSM